MSYYPKNKFTKAESLHEALITLRMTSLDTREEFNAFYVPVSQVRNEHEADRILKMLKSK